MPGKRGRTGMTLGRIVLLAVSLTLAAQIALLYIGMSYANSIDRSISSQKKHVISDQFQRNVLHQLDDINNLLLLLQTSEFSNYFKFLMKLREPEVTEPEKRKLLEKIEALQLSEDIIDSIYLIGANVNQASYRKATNEQSFEELPDLHMDAFDYAKLKDFFLRHHDRFHRYNANETESEFNPHSELLSEANVSSLRNFLHNIENRIVITNGNKSGVFIVIVLGDDIFRRVLPDNLENSHYSIVNDEGEVIWSTASEPELLRSVAHATRGIDTGSEAYSHSVKELPAYRIHVVDSSMKVNRSLFESSLVGRMLVISTVTLLLTFLISFLYLKQVFKAFRTISSKLKNKLINDNNEMVLQAIPENLAKKGFHTISMRNKLILMFCIAVSIPSTLNGMLYSRYLTEEVDHWLADSVEELGQFSVVSITNQVRFLENITNEIAVSQQFQDYLIHNYVYKSPGTSNTGQIILHMFPGLNNVSYFVLLDESGNSLYSSIYSNNKDIFSTDPRLFQNRGDPYWIANYKDVFNHTSIAVIRRIELVSYPSRITYLLLVPKESIFRIAESEKIRTAYAITDQAGNRVDSYHTLSDGRTWGQPRYTNTIPGTGWHIEIEYMFNDVMLKSQAYQQQFLLSILIVFLIASGLAVMIASVLTKPIKQLKETMLAASGDGVARRLLHEEKGEIAGIITSYNGMIEKLEQTIRHNMQITEENARNKIRENELLSMKTQAELNMLQAQINPHFLYNTLETINMQSMKHGHHEIGVIVNALADLLRYSISKGADTALLDKELNHAANYLTIQQIRFGNFEAAFDVPGELRRYSVLRFILQPIIENSIKHGFVGWDSGGFIHISAAVEDDALIIRITDNGVGMDRRTLEALIADMERGMEEWKPEQSGIGLKNVYMRLKLFYKQKVSMDIESGLMKGTIVTIRLPLHGGGES